MMSAAVCWKHLERRIYGSAILCLIAVLAATAQCFADGRVYTPEEPTTCRELARIGGVYAVYARHDDEARTRSFDIVLTPGVKASGVATKARDILAARLGEKWVTAVLAEIYVFHDPTKTEDFRRTFSASEFFISEYGFPDSRGPRVDEVRGQFDPSTGKLQGGWTITPVYSDPARFQTGN